MPKYFFASLLFLYGLATSAVAAGMEIAPFRTTNQSPLKQIFGIPSETGTAIITRGNIGVSLTEDIANGYAFSSTRREWIIQDFESYRWTMAARYGLGERFEVGIEIPYILYGGGFLDSFVIDWHDFFQLPQGGRDIVPKDHLRLRYSKNGVTKLNFEHAGSGIGDISLTGGMQIYDSRIDRVHNSLALRGTLKLPSGDSSELRGSGSIDLSLLLCGSMNNLTEWGTVGLFGSIGGMAMSNGSVLTGQQQNLVGLVNIGTGWAPAEWISFKAQLNITSPFYSKSSLDELSGASMMLVLGGSIKLPGDYLLDIGVSEDVLVATAPDVAFHFGLSKHF